MVSLLLVVSVVATVPEGAAQASPLCDATASNAIVGTDGDDVIYGTNKKDVILGLGGDDVIYAGNGKDVVCGGAGNDEIYGGNGKDFLDGGAGTDVLDGGKAKDVCENGETLVSCETGTPVGTTTSTAGPTTTTATTTSTSTTTTTTSTSTTTSTTSTSTSTSTTTTEAPPVEGLELTADSTNLSDGSGEVVFTVSTSLEVESITLQDVLGRSIEMVADGAGGFTAVVSWSELVGGETYDFIAGAVLVDGTVELSETVPVVVAERELPAVYGSVTPPAGTDPIAFLQFVANQGANVLSMDLEASIPALADLPADLRDLTTDPGSEQENFRTGTWTQRITTGSTPMPVTAELIRGWQESGEIFSGAAVYQAKVAYPTSEVRDVIATAGAADIQDSPALSPSSQLVATNAAPTIRTAGIVSQDFAPAGGGNFTDEPFWPTKSKISWAESATLDIDPESTWWVCRKLGTCGPKSFEFRSITAGLTGLDEFFKPYFNEYQQRAYEFDIAQLRDDLVDPGDERRWLLNFDHGIDGPGPLGPQCDIEGTRNFPIERYTLQDWAGFRITDINIADSDAELFVTNLDGDAGAYPDTFVGDQCSRMEIGFGITNPSNVTEQSIYLRMLSSKGSVDTATLGLRHQAIDATPADDIDWYNLVDINRFELEACRAYTNGGFFTGTEPIGDEFCTGVANKDLNQDANIAPINFHSANQPVGYGEEPWLTIDFNARFKSLCSRYLTDVNAISPSEPFAPTTQYPFEDGNGDTQFLEVELPEDLRWGVTEASTCRATRWGDDRIGRIERVFDGDGLFSQNRTRLETFSGFGLTAVFWSQGSDFDEIAPVRVLSDPLRSYGFVRKALDEANAANDGRLSEPPHLIQEQIFNSGNFSGLNLVGIVAPSSSNQSGPRFIRVGATGADWQAIRTFPIVPAQEL